MMPIPDLQREKLAELCRRASATRLEVFGSAARDDFDPATSDIDFLVEFEDLPPARYAEAYFDLKENIESLFGRPVDLVTPASLVNPYFRDRVLAERRLVYAR
ncbi:MAG: nucleotidyltransferase family protein [Hyphomicrobiaceae bacterium]|nr:nucleotidyltransferase family protein [Hyphomicrobiaceae bacterium]